MIVSGVFLVESRTAGQTVSRRCGPAPFEWKMSALECNSHVPLPAPQIIADDYPIGTSRLDDGVINVEDEWQRKQPV